MKSRRSSISSSRRRARAAAAEEEERPAAEEEAAVEAAAVARRRRPIDRRALQQVVGMGFEPDAALAALQRAGWSVEVAVATLLG